MPGTVIILAILYDVIDSCFDPAVDVFEDGRRRISGEIGGSGYDGFAKTFDQVAAKRFVDQSDCNCSVSVDKVIRQSHGAFINDGGRSVRSGQKIEDAQVRLAGIFENIPLIRHQDDEAFRFRPLFQGIYFSYCVRVGRIAADTPDRIGRVEEETACLQGSQRSRDVIFEVLTVFHDRKNSMFAKKSVMELKELIAEAWGNRELLKDARYADAVRAVIEEVDKGRLRVAAPGASGVASPAGAAASGWTVNEWVKQAILLYFGIQPMQTWEMAPFEFYDKMLLKKNYKELGVRAVPHAVARYGAFLARNVVLMPSYVNIGAYVDEGTMVDTWATVGSCAQIGKGVHLSGGVGIGGVLEPLQASPVIIEDGAFLGSRSIVVEGVIVEKEAVLGANVVLTQSTKIIDVSGSEPIEYKGRVPSRSVVIPGSYAKKFPAGEYSVSCALIIGRRKPSTDLKTSLNDALRDFNVAV